MDHRFNGGSAGILGLEHNPFLVLADPNAARLNVRDITPPSGITPHRVSFRRRMLGAIDRLERHAAIQPAAYHALDEHYKTALNMITAPGDASGPSRSKRKTTGCANGTAAIAFGQSCLLARRLIEAGVRFVTITDEGWDTHQNNFTVAQERLVPPIDRGLPQLIADLEDRGMLATTLVVWVTDFGRTPNVNSASGRDHWASSGFAVMAGAGVPGGAILGATDDEGAKVVRDEYFTRRHRGDDLRQARLARRSDGELARRPPDPAGRRPPHQRMGRRARRRPQRLAPAARSASRRVSALRQTKNSREPFACPSKWPKGPGVASLLAVRRRRRSTAAWHFE